MLLTLDRDEVPHFYVAPLESTDSDQHDMTIEVTELWWKEYQDVRDHFYKMQSQLAGWYGDEDWFPEDGPDCD